MAHRVLPGAGLVSLAVLLAACGDPAGAAGGEPPPPQVGVVAVAPQPYELTVQLPGRIAAFQVSEVRPQIGGIVRARRFEEGATVSAGQVLYEIDAGPAQADLSSAQAAAASAQARYQRYQDLIAIGAVSQQELDDARAAADQASAALNNARISVGYTRVVAPIAGIIGASNVTPGALAVPAQSEPFAVIQNIDRVYVDMQQSSSDMLRLRQRVARNGDARVRVRLVLPDGSEYGHEGELRFSEVSVNPSTGAVRLRASFPNPDHLLLPGMFVQARLVETADQQVILAPQQSVTRNADGDAVVFVLNGDNVVEPRIIQTGETAGDKWVVLSGLNAGDRMIVDGLQRVRPGATVTPVDIAAEQPIREGAIELRGRRNG